MAEATEAGRIHPQPHGPAGAAPEPRVQLPRPPTRLFGGEPDIRAVAARLDPSRSSVRVLSLIGPVAWARRA